MHADNMLDKRLHFPTVECILHFGLYNLEGVPGRGEQCTMQTTKVENSPETRSHGTATHVLTAANATCKVPALTSRKSLESVLVRIGALVLVSMRCSIVLTAVWSSSSACNGESPTFKRERGPKRPVQLHGAHYVHALLYAGCALQNLQGL